MCNKPVLVVLAAGMGSRYGGLKQLDALGPQGQCILDYSLYDAAHCGFEEAVLVIREDFKDAAMERFSKAPLKISYAYQRLDDLPIPVSVPPERKKMWGTGHALYAAREYIHGPFGVIGADDFYGRGTFAALYDGLRGSGEELCMVAHILKNTLSPGGSVSRGVCQVEDGYLSGVTERINIHRREDGEIVYGDNEGALPEDTPVSMIVWGLKPWTLPLLEQSFGEFLKTRSLDSSEFYLPSFIDELIKGGKGRMKVLETPEKWMGVTYKDDKQGIMEALSILHAKGLYSQGSAL